MQKKATVASRIKNGIIGAGVVLAVGVILQTLAGFNCKDILQYLIS